MEGLSHARRHAGGTATERGIAVIEAMKGLAVVLIGAGFTVALHRDHDVEEVARSLLLVLHLGEHRHLSAIFLRAADTLQDTNLMVIAGVAAVYSLLRFVEAYGLWNGRSWAEWFALISGAVYLPLEVYEILRRPTLIRLAILVINILIVSYIGWLRWRSHVRAESGRVAA